MKKIILTIIAVFITLCSISAKHKKIKICKHGVVVSNIQSIYMHRTACFGKCPDYIIEINNNGNVKYSGVRFVKDTGVYEKHFKLASIKALFDQFSQARLDTCKDEYENRIPDLPGLIYKITYKDKVKNIRNAHSGPLFLRFLSSSVDSLVQVDDSWKKLPNVIIKR